MTGFSGICGEQRGRIHYLIGPSQPVSSDPIGYNHQGPIYKVEEWLVPACLNGLIQKSCFKRDYKRQNNVPDLETRKFKCLYCQKEFNPEQSAKNIKVFWRIFVLAIEHQPHHVYSYFSQKQSPEEDNTECTFCTEEYPDFQFFYDPEDRIFFHATKGYIPTATDKKIKKISWLELIRLAKYLTAEPQIKRNPENACLLKLLTPDP